MGNKPSSEEEGVVQTGTYRYTGQAHVNPAFSSSSPSLPDPPVFVIQPGDEEDVAPSPTSPPLDDDKTQKTGTDRYTGQAHVNPEFSSSSPSLSVPPVFVIQSGDEEDVAPPPTSSHQDDDKTQKEPEVQEEGFLLGRVEHRDVEVRVGDNIRVTEVAPSNSGIYEEHTVSTADDDGRWKMPLSLFTSKKKGPDVKDCKKRIRSYYKAQDELIETFEELQLEIDDAMDNTEVAKDLRRKALFYARLTFGFNLVLLAAKIFASYLSGSIAIISSLVDSVVDLLSGIIIWWASRAVKKRDPYIYPQGRTKLEPVAIIILSVIMAAASLQLIRESIQKIVNMATSFGSLPIVEAPTFAIVGGTIAIKFVLWMLCRRINSNSVRALAQDHRNDVFSNAVAIVCGYLGSQDMLKRTGMPGFGYVDPGGAILISIYIVYNWWQTGAEQIRYLTGYTARPEFLSKITWICVNHHKKILHIDTVRAFHFGNNFLVEVDIVLPETMSMNEAHDIGEPLQLKLEALPEVERAFVHLDYEFTHNPKSEHKIV